jgi:hypothetical protein
VKSELANCLLTQGTFKKNLVGGSPHLRYIRVCHCLPMVDRAMQKLKQIVDDHAKKLTKPSVPLK